MSSMKTENLVLLGGAALVAYMLLNKKAAPSLLDDVAGGIGNTIDDVSKGLREAELGAGQGILYAGGQANKILNPGAYAALGPSAGDVLANTDFINQYFGAQVISGSIIPTYSGSGVLALRAGQGIPTAQAQAYIDAAVRAAPESYGVSLASGGVNVFNLTSQGKAATTTNKGTSTNPVPSNFGSLAASIQQIQNKTSGGTANLASLMARGL